MKKAIIAIVILICLSILFFVIFTKADDETLTFEKALEIGEEKYLKFLWIVDGAFNSERFKEDFIVNNRKLGEEEKVFICKYPNKKSKECIGNNFENEFQKLFSKKINYEKVYSDDVLYSWISLKNGEYVFNDIDSCNVNRMGINHQLKVMNISDTKIIYEVEFLNNQTSKMTKRDFVLVLEDNEWKISSAFYYDLCGMRYTIY